MNAINKPAANVNDVIKLADEVPLESPYVITLSTGNICDFRCIYCGQFNNDAKKSAENNIPELMSLENFTVLAEQIKEFKKHVKQISFISQGETILNKSLPDMIKIVKENNLAKKTKVLTNAYSLTNEYSDRLIDAGLDQLFISLQGLSSEKYKEICGININYDKFFNQIKYFYKNRGNCKVYIKIIDISLDDNEEDLFNSMYGEYCDYIFIEKCQGKYSKNKDIINKFGFELKNMEICPTPFYKMWIKHNGDVMPCCSGSVVQNIYKKNIKRIWDEDFCKLQIQLLKQEIESNQKCFNCVSFKSREREEDNLDFDREEIIRRYSVKK